MKRELVLPLPIDRNVSEESEDTSTFAITLYDIVFHLFAETVVRY